MRILILEDTKERKNSFVEKLKKFKFHVHVVETADDCIESLRLGPWDWLCLDHDVPVEQESVYATGYDVAKWLEQNPDRMPAAILIHSANPVGLRNIQAALPQAILAPNLWEYVDEVILKLDL